MQAQIILRAVEIFDGYKAIVLPLDSASWPHYSYETGCFIHKKYALKEARDFCKWKKMRVGRIWDRTKL